MPSHGERGRCYLVYGLAPAGVGARTANDALNEYVEDARRGVPVFHDHFTGTPHGGFVVLFIDSGDQREQLQDLGPLEGWEIGIHPLVYSLTPVGFAELIAFSLRTYGNTSLEELRATEEPDPRYWWRMEAGPREPDE